MKKPVKEKIKAKTKATKRKVKGKIKASVAVVAAILGLTVFNGCSTATPASRATSATYTFTFNFGDGTKSASITNTLGDGALASADSAGSTETQTATPTVDVRPDIDVRYNDAIAGATTASKGVLDTLAQTGVEKVLALMQTGGSGTVTVEKKDGTPATVRCEGGQCSLCEDGNCTPSASK